MVMIKNNDIYLHSNSKLEISKWFARKGKFEYQVIYKYYMITNHS